MTRPPLLGGAKGGEFALRRPGRAAPARRRLDFAVLRARSGGARRLPGPGMAEPRRDRRSDRQLLTLAATTEPEAFTVFYRRHVDVVLTYLRRRTASPEAAALRALHTNVEPGEIDVPAAWLLGIARNKLFESYRRGRIEAAARERLGMEPLVLDDTDLALVEELSETDVVNQLADLLPADQLEALRARVIDERGYDEIARDLDCSEAVVRKRVSRALRTLRARSGDGS